MSIYVDIKKNFENFSLNVQFEANSEVIALLGASGCGKSMTLKCIAGIVKPDNGVIIANGRTLFDSKSGINLPPQERNVGMLFQNYALFPNMTVRENILAVLTRTKKKAENVRDRLSALIERFYMEGLENHYPQQLSGGQQQRAALARIMASAPGIIMLDEPLSALDSYLRWQLELELMQMLDEFGGTTIFVSHSRDEVYRICDKVCPMTEGCARAVYNTKKLFESPNSLTACLLSGCKNYSRAEKRDGKQLYALDWKAELFCSAPIPGNIAYIGVRAHYIRRAKNEETENVIACRVLRVIEDMFSVIITALPVGVNSRRDFSCIRMELPRDETDGIEAGDDIKIIIKPDDIIPLTK